MRLGGGRLEQPLTTDGTDPVEVTGERRDVEVVQVRAAERTVGLQFFAIGTMSTTAPRLPAYHRQKSTIPTMTCHWFAAPFAALAAKQIASPSARDDRRLLI
jgi:hypothetical protein